MDGKLLTVLMVDDEERFRSAISRQLSVRGFNVIEASNGSEAVRIVQEHFVDIVVLDQKMPVMNGTQAFKEIKKIDPLIEIIMLTGHATVEEAIDLMKEGAFDYIMKPVNIDELLFKIEDAYTKRNLEQHIRKRETEDD